MKDNDINDGSFLSVLLTLKENIMFNLNVAEVMVVERIDEDKVICHDINNDTHTWTCFKLKGLEVNEDDLVVVIFTNTDFRTNLKKVQNDSQTQNGNPECLHSKDCGIIIGILYQKGGEENE